MVSEVPDDSIIYTKQEESVFLDKTLQKSRGIVRVKIDFDHHASKVDDKQESDTYNPNFGFDEEFESNGTYLIEKMYCKKQGTPSLSYT